MSAGERYTGVANVTPHNRETLSNSRSQCRITLRRELVRKTSRETTDEQSSSRAYREIYPFRSFPIEMPPNERRESRDSVDPGGGWSSSLNIFRTTTTPPRERDLACSEREQNSWRRNSLARSVSKVSRTLIAERSKDQRLA